MKSVTYDDISDADSQLDRLKTAYLNRFGWSYSSDNPGSFWLWRRTFDGRTYVVDADTAIRMTREKLDNE